MKSLIDQKPSEVLSRVEKMEFKWVLLGGVLLSFLGGNINVMMLFPSLMAFSIALGYWGLRKKNWL